MYRDYQIISDSIRGHAIFKDGRMVGREWHDSYDQAADELDDIITILVS